MKRTIDILLAVLVMLLLGPFMLLVALSVYASDQGPIFFKQRRVGLHGAQFSIYKFRSMKTDAERLGGYSTAVGDPRITRVGRFIRRTSLDELPQIINVLRGQMSMVGPRPDVPAQQSLYSDAEWRLRHSVKPGITGLAQATVRSSATHAERTELDLRYARESNMRLDLKILVMTFMQVVTKGGN
jgi:lipopolysaccharide/colanic/teichoic acid biosynthesis glycosyltransferase